EEVVAFGAGKGGGEVVIRMADKNVCPTQLESRVAMQEAGDEAHGNGVIDFADWFSAAGAEPAPTDESVVVVGEGGKFILTLTISAEYGGIQIRIRIRIRIKIRIRIRNGKGRDRAFSV